MFKLKALLFLFIVASFTTCDAIKLPDTTFIEEAPLKMRMVEEIVRKICNISLDTFANKSAVEKADLIVRLEEKLNKSAQDLGEHGTKYVKLIMKGIKAKAFVPYAAERRMIQSPAHMGNSLSKIKAPAVLRESPTSDSDTSDKKTSHKHKGSLIHAISNKIDMLAKSYLDLAKTKEERQLAIKKIKKLLIESAKNTNSIKPEELKKYVELVGRGFEVMMLKGAGEYADQRKKMDVDLSQNIDRFDLSLNIDEDPLGFDMPRDNKLDHEGSKLRVFDPQSAGLAMNPWCNHTIEETCHNIKSVKTRMCSSGNKEFSILKLCDGYKDCSDNSDEIKCTTQAIDTIRTTDRLMDYIESELSHKCYPDLADRSLLGKQNKILRDVLKQQLTYLTKNSMNTSVKRDEYLTGATKETFREAINVVDSLTSALGTSMCRDLSGKERVHTRIDYMTDIHQINGDPNSETTLAPEVCKCNGKTCARTCTQRCSNICEEMYTLGRFTCQAVSGEKSVPLGLICDGKLDCYDETDEKDCSLDASLAKFEATNMYHYILKDIETKVLTVTQSHVRAKLQNLLAAVTKYQKMSLNRKPDISEVKRFRDAMFKELMAVYEGAVIYFKDDELFEMRFGLVTMKERLISAVKRSNTGNEKIISSDGCACRGYNCALPRCSKTCHRACSAEPQLTRFFCGDLTDPLNNTLPIELLCNGKANCANGEDEKDCKIGACRSLHLKLLRKKIQECGRVHVGTALGEALRSWRIKAQASLSLAEEGSRPTPPVLHEILRGLLRDLVVAYSSLEDRVNNSTVLLEFTTCARVVMDTLKSCNA